VVVTGDEAHHIRAARRLKVGDEIVLFDGAGTEARCTIVRVDRHDVEVAVESRITHDRPPGRLTLAVAMPKGKRQDVLIEKATELSVSAVWPMITHRSVVRPDATRVPGWQRTAVEAAKQSHQPFLPEMAAPVPFADVLVGSSDFDTILLASLSDRAAPVGEVWDRTKPSAGVLALVGPEGGFDDEEQDAAVAAGAVAVRLAPGILRTETAAIAAAAVWAARRSR